MRLFFICASLGVVHGSCFALQKNTVFKDAYLVARAEELANKIKQADAKDEIGYQMAWKGALVYAVMAKFMWDRVSALKKDREALVDDDKKLEHNQDAIEKNQENLTALVSVLSFLAQRALDCAQHAWRGKRNTRIMVREELRHWDDFELVERMLDNPELSKFFDDKVCAELRAWVADKRAEFLQETPLLEIEHGMRVCGVIRNGVWPDKPDYLTMIVIALLSYNKLNNFPQAEEQLQKG